MDADSSSLVASGVGCSFFPSNQKIFVQLLLFLNHLLPQSIHVTRRKLESDDSESFATYKMLLCIQARFPKRCGRWQVKSPGSLAFDERVQFLPESVLHE